MMMPTLRRASLALAAALLGAAAAQACSCLLSPSPEVARQGAATVFEGRLLSDEPQGPRERSMTFQVSAVWKGEVPARFALRTPLLGAACGLEGVDVGETWILYTHRSADGVDRIGLCNRHVLSSAEERDALGPSRPPGPARRAGSEGRRAGSSGARDESASVFSEGFSTGWQRGGALPTPEHRTGR